MRGDEEEGAALEVRVVLKGKLIERFERIQETIGIESRADVLRHLITAYTLPPPRFEHVNTYEDRITVKDNVLNRTANVWLKDDGSVSCDLCQLETCHHIDYALGLVQVARVLKEKGWSRKI